MPPDSRQFLHGLPPVIGEGARVLILGSFPSRLSLDTGQYYANPRNQFWKILERLTGIRSGLPYSERLAHLVSRRIALWDAVASCRREGSADSRIVSPVRNPVADLVSSHPGIRLIACNGNAAARFAGEAVCTGSVPVLRLPSTSPANARLSFDEKVKAWSVILQSPGQ